MSLRRGSDQTVPVHAFPDRVRQRSAGRASKGWLSAAPYASGGNLSHKSWMMLHWTLLQNEGCRKAIAGTVQCTTGSISRSCEI